MLSFFSCMNKIILSCLICTLAMLRIIYTCHIEDVCISERLLVIYSIFFGVFCRNVVFLIKNKFLFLFFLVSVFCDFIILNKPGVLFPSFLFFVACRGNNALSFLKKYKGLTRLSNISYSIFHLHGIVWYLMFLFMGGVLKEATDVFFLCIITVGFLFILFFSVVFYFFVEKKAYKYGKALIDKI